MIYKTIALKIHQPSQKKQKLMDDAMLRYAIALEFLLANMKKSVEKKQPLEISKSLMDRLNAFRVEPFKDSLRKDAKAILASYLSRKRSGQTVSYPKVYVDHYQCNKSIQKLIELLQDYEISKTQFLRKMAKILEKYRKPKTIFFCRNAKNRDFSLLYQPDSGKYYAKIYLMNYADAISNPTLDQKGEPGSLIYVSPEKEVFSNSSKRIRYILVPLEFGKWQEQYLKMAFEQPGMIKTARLVKKKKDYYLYVNLQFKGAEKKEAVNYLGILPKAPDRVDYLLLNRQKEVRQEGSFVGAGENQDQKNTALAKEIVALVKVSQCQLVVYNPKIKGESFAGGQIWQMPAADYQQLLAKIEQRIGEEGLLEPIRVSPRGLFTTCPKCQHNSKKNLMTEQLFVCNRCGYSGLTERLGLYNLAAKLLTYENKALVFHLTKQKERLIIRNLRLGVEFITNVDVFYLKRFVIFLEEEYQRGMRVIAGEEKYYGEDYKQKYLLWRKLAALKRNNDSIEDYIVIEN